MIFEPGLIRRIESSSARVTMGTAAAFADRAAEGPARAVAFAGGTLAAFGPGRYVNRAVGVSLDDLDDDQLSDWTAGTVGVDFVGTGESLHDDFHLG